MCPPNNIGTAGFSDLNCKRIFVSFLLAITVSKVVFVSPSVLVNLWMGNIFTCVGITDVADNVTILCKVIFSLKIMLAMYNLKIQWFGRSVSYRNFERSKKFVVW